MQNTAFWLPWHVCTIFLFVAPVAFTADSTRTLGESREFWVGDLNVSPPQYKKISAELKATGPRSYIYLEKNAQEVSDDFLNRIEKRLEVEGSPHSAFPRLGIIPLEERVFSSLPTKMTADDRLVVLFADLGKYKNFESDGFFNLHDQMLEADALKLNHHSNQVNIVYVNTAKKSEDFTVGVISHALQHLLAMGASGESNFIQERWLSEVQAEGAMLLNGLFTHQTLVDEYSRNPGQYPLVTHGEIQGAANLLFSSYLLDSIPQGWSALGFLAKLNTPGREAVEFAYRQKSDAPLTFDAIFSNFLTYIFENSNGRYRLPQSWSRAPFAGILLAEIKSSGKIESFPDQLEGALFPYSFVAIDLTEPLPPTALVQVENLPRSPAANSCSNSASLLWKPISAKRIAVYAVGCEHKNKEDLVHFRLNILDKPSLLPSSPLKISF